MGKAMIVVDVQNDFCPGGALAVEQGHEVARAITEHLSAHHDEYDLVAATMDWHPPHKTLEGFEHFSDEPDYAQTWPQHCVAGTEGAALHEDLDLPSDAVIVRKGQRDAGYSGFEGHDDSGRSLAELLADRGIDAVDVAGLATDHCVRATALDARRHGLTVRLLEPLARGVAEETSAAALEEMSAAGIDIVTDMSYRRVPQRPGCHSTTPR